MDNYQKYLIELFSKYRPSPKYPTYPPYHEGLYLEDYFFDKFVKSDIQLDRYYIPVFWTTCYVDGCFLGLQEIINSLDPNKKYFTVAQHDDAIREKLPSDTISFNAGGNGGGIPIPLICSPIPEKYKQNVEKDIFCSFVGSITHPIRANMCNVLSGDPKYKIYAKNHSPAVSESDFTNFVNITSRSIFSLCPRGYGRSSFRLYEAIQLKSIPVFVYDYKWCPFEEDLDWNSFSVLIDANNIQNIDKILTSIDNAKIKEMQENLESYWINNFTMESIYKKIINYDRKI
jgi:hypothetical protein